MLENLKLLEEELKHNPDMIVSRGCQYEIITSLESAIEILEKLRRKDNDIK